MTVQIKVSSMMCDGCVKTIATAIKAEDPEAEVTADLGTKILTVVGNASESVLKETIKAVGHEIG